MQNSTGNRLVHFICTNSYALPSYNVLRGEVMLEGLFLLPPRWNDMTQVCMSHMNHERDSDAYGECYYFVMHHKYLAMHHNISTVPPCGGGYTTIFTADDDSVAGALLAGRL